MRKSTWRNLLNGSTESRITDDDILNKAEIVAVSLKKVVWVIPDARVLNSCSVFLHEIPQW